MAIAAALVIVPIGVLFFVSGLIVNLIQAIIFVIVRPFSKSLFRRMNRMVAELLWLELVWIVDWWAGVKVNLYTDPETLKMMGKEHALVIANHKSDIDWLIGWVFAQRSGCLGSTLAVMKKSSKFLPVIGWSMWFSEYLFLERSWAKDESTLKSGLQRLKDYPQPFWLALFVEGTRFTQAKLLAAQEYASSMGLPVPRNVLIPRTKGFVTSVSEMRSFAPAIIDMTVAIPKGSTPPTMLRLFKGKSDTVDIIAIDFSENRFRLKQPLIKAAIERGVYFELTYSGLVLDPQLRRQIISNAKLLVDWTRGKNIIFSSAAPSVTELRGPYDVANLACLLGFSMERAKASVSKTCRSLLENALRKKKFYKEAIRVELISPTEQINGFDDWLKWDPISSGEGDLHLDDMEKSFAASSKESKTVKAIDFVSIMNELPSHGLHIKDIVYGDNNASNIGLLTTTKADKPTDVYNTPIDLKLHDPPKTYQTSVTETLLSENENLEALTSVEGGEPCAMIIEEETKIPNESNVCLSNPEVEQQNTQAEVHEAVYEENLSCEKGSANICNDVPATGISASFGNKPSTNDSICPPVVASNEVGIEQNKGTMVSSFFDSFLREEENMKDAGDVVVTPINSSLPLSCGSLNEDIQEECSTVKDEDISVAPSSTSVTLRSDDELQNIGASTAVHEPLEVASMEFQVELKDDSHIDNSYAQQSSSGKVGRKQGSSRRSVSSVSLPFNRLLKHSQFKKSRKPKTKSTILSLSELIE